MTEVASVDLRTKNLDHRGRPQMRLNQPRTRAMPNWAQLHFPRGSIVASVSAIGIHTGRTAHEPCDENKCARVYSPAELEVEWPRLTKIQIKSELESRPICHQQWLGRRQTVYAVHMLLDR